MSERSAEPFAIGVQIFAHPTSYYHYNHNHDKQLAFIFFIQVTHYYHHHHKYNHHKQLAIGIFVHAAYHNYYNHHHNDKLEQLAIFIFAFYYPPGATFTKNSGKRGLVYTNGTLTYPFSQAGQGSQVNWAYNYAQTRNTGTNGVNCDFNPALTFIPMLFNDNAALTSTWPAAAQAAIDTGSDALFSFNEPDLCGQGSACMTVNQSVAAYKAYMQPFAGKAKLGAPAISFAGPPAGLTYLQSFMGNCTGCQVDFINLHWYSSFYLPSYLSGFIVNASNLFPGIPIWVTEYGSDGGYSTDAQTQTFLQETAEWMDAATYVERYAYWSDVPLGEYTGNANAMINANGSGLCAEGQIFNSFTGPCPGWQTATTGTICPTPTPVPRI